MGQRWFDQYSLLHFAVGVVAYFIGITFNTFSIMHGIFEMSENTKYGIWIINKYLWWFWPGGKPESDAIQNMIGDQISSMIG